MSKNSLNFLIDVILFIVLSAITGIGLLIKYVLISGSERWIKYGQNVNLTFWGLDRHDWGKIHLILAFILILFLVLHILFHWKLILCIYKKLISNQMARIGCVLLFIIVSLGLVFFPFFVSIDVQEMDRGKEKGRLSVETEYHQPKSMNKKREKMKERFDLSKSNEKEIEHHQLDSLVDIKGYMTLQEVSDKYQIPCNVIKEKLNIPISTSNLLKLGQLKKQYNFTMSEVETIICNY